MVVRRYALHLVSSVLESRVADAAYYIYIYIHEPRCTSTSKLIFNIIINIIYVLDIFDLEVHSKVHVPFELYVWSGYSR